MLKTTLVFGLLAAIGFAVPANAQNVVSGSQTIDSTTVGVNGSNVISSNDQELTQVLLNHDFDNFGFDGNPNLVVGGQDIDATTVGANDSNVLSHNDQAQTSVLIDSAAGNWYPYYPQPIYGEY